MPLKTNGQDRLGKFHAHFFRLGGRIGRVNKVAPTFGYL